MSQMEYRLEFVSWALVSSLWISLSLVTVNLIFGHVSSIGSWTRQEVLLVVCLNGIFTSLLWMFVTPSLLQLSERVRRGSLDHFLIKPVNIRFLVSANSFDMDNIFRVVFLLFYLFFVIRITNYSISPISLISFIVVVSAGLVMFYNIFFMLATTSFWFIDISNLEELMNSLLSISRFPTYIFDQPLRFVFMFLIPLAFVATFPTQFLIGKENYSLVLIATTLAVAFSVVSQWFWNFALKRYSSASS